MADKIAPTIAIVASCFAAFFFIDGRYVQRQLFSDFRWTQEARAISETQDEIGFAERDGDLQRLARKQEELEHLVDVFCHEFPEDRECK